MCMIVFKIKNPSAWLKDVYGKCSSITPFSGK